MRTSITLKQNGVYFRKNALIAQFIAMMCLYVSFSFLISNRIIPFYTHTHQHSTPHIIKVISKLLLARVETTNSKISTKEKQICFFFVRFSFISKLFQSRYFNMYHWDAITSRHKRMKIMKFTSAKNILQQCCCWWWLGKKIQQQK